MSFSKGEIVKPSFQFQTSLGIPITHIRLARVEETFFARSQKQVLKLKVLEATGSQTIKNGWFESVDANVYGPKHTGSSRRQPYRCGAKNTIYVYASAMRKAERDNKSSQNELSHPTQTEFQKLAGYTPMSLNKDIHTILILD